MELQIPKLSVVVIAYNMAREVPRTILSLSARMQRDIGEADYEVILVDNGSTSPFDEDLCRAYIPGIRILHVASPTSSPVPAINLGLAEASGDLIGVFIDGARIASPGLLSMARAAACVHERPVIGTLAFHLGPDVQDKSTDEGYNQQVEDELLAESGWEDDGYRLFSISVFAPSSRFGWFMLPAETNSLFLSRKHWDELGGYDPAFVTPGGGLANIDIWQRTTSDPAARPVLLLGEGTFHQVHGTTAGLAARAARWKLFQEEFLRLRGYEYERRDVTPLLFGRMRPEALKSMQLSLKRFAARQDLSVSGERND